MAFPIAPATEYGLPADPVGKKVEWTTDSADEMKICCIKALLIHRHVTHAKNQTPWKTIFSKGWLFI